jgi:hypothetical protein
MEYLFYFILILYFKHNWMSSTKIKINVFILTDTMPPSQISHYINITCRFKQRIHFFIN